MMELLATAGGSIVIRQWMASLTAVAVRMVARLITAARPVWQGLEPLPGQRIYFANHASHGDFVLIWMTLPPRLRRRARPVAGADYWRSSELKRFLIHDVFHGVLIERVPDPNGENPLDVMNAALDAGDSLILFPEGTRNTTDQPLQAFRSGIYRLARAHPEVELVPVWIDNLNRVLPKGEVVPIPLLCSVIYGEPLFLQPQESREAFLERARAALLALSSAHGGEKDD